jgi:copper chaperone CopZ
MKFILYIALSILTLATIASCTAQSQIQNPKTETVHIFGNCSMCKKTIEKAALKSGEAIVKWDKSTKMAEITFDAAKTNTDAILQRIAEAGYDSDKFRATDDVYANLPECCQYERPEKL